MRIGAARERRLLDREPVATGLGERVQDRLVDVQQVGVDDHRAGLAGEHREHLTVDAEDSRLGLGVEQCRVHPRPSRVIADVPTRAMDSNHPHRQAKTHLPGSCGQLQKDGLWKTG